MMIKNIGLSVSLVLLLVLQGCGGGGSTSVSNDDASAQESANTTTNSGDSTNVTTLSSTTTQSEQSSNSSEGNTSVSYYILREKKIVMADENQTTSYSRSASNPYTVYSQMRSTKGDLVEKKYDYNSSSKVLNVSLKDAIGEWVLSERATFEMGEMKDFVDFSVENNRYLINTFDIFYMNGMRVVERIRDIEKELFNVERFSYEDGAIKKIQAGYYDSLDDTSMTITSEDIHTTASKVMVSSKSDDNMTLYVGNNTYKFIKVGE